MSIILTEKTMKSQKDTESAHPTFSYIKIENVPRKIGLLRTKRLDCSRNQNTIADES